MTLHQTLTSRHVTLQPLSDVHREGLRTACDADTETWQAFYPYSMAGEHFDGAWARAMADQARGETLFFAVMVGGEVIGQTAYITPNIHNRSVEIGATYYHPAARGGAVNPAAKRLLLGHAFDLGLDRLWFKVDAINNRSRAAVLKLGAVFEGIHRHERVTWTGRVRDTAFYSILADEWPAVRERLDQRLTQFE